MIGIYWKKFYVLNVRAFLCITMLVPLYNQAQKNEPSKEWRKIQSIPISSEVDAWFTDLQQTLYLVNKDEITKIGSPFNTVQSIKSWQSIDVIEPINPFKLLLFSASQQQICIADNTLALTGDCFPLEALEIANVTAISSSKRPDMFWIYDEVNSTILLYNYLTKTLVQSLYNFKGLLGLKGKITLKENETGLWVISDRNEIVLLDDYLNKVYTFQLAFDHAVPYKNGILYSDQNTLYFTNRYDGSKAVHKISTQETIKKIHVSGNQLYIELDQRIDVFIIP